MMINEVNDIDIVFSGYVQNPRKLFDLIDIYLEDKFGKIILMDEAGKCIDKTSRELLHRYVELNEFSILNEVRKNAITDIKSVFSESEQLNKVRGEYEFLYHSKIIDKEIDINLELFKTISDRVLHEGLRKEHMKLIEGETGSKPKTHGDISFSLKVVNNLSDNQRNKLLRATKKWVPFVRLDDMINYAFDWMDLKNKDSYQYTKFLTRRAELDKMARKCNTEGEFVKKVKANIQKYAAIEYLKDERKFDRYLRGIYRRANNVV